uniref:Head-tail joining protein n=1 Tax=viral metagenome TaxID=1070528 RepID=A0A6H1ZJF9_9ZZZZ
MSLISGFLDTLVDVYSITRDKYTDSVKTIIYSSIKVRWVEKVSRVLSANAEIKLSSVSVWMLPEYTISQNYEFVKSGKTYKVLSYETRKNLNGVEDHIKVFLA